jgi:hypothetical protein
MARPIDMDLDEVPVAPKMAYFKATFLNLKNVAIAVVYFDADDEDFVNGLDCGCQGTQQRFESGRQGRIARMAQPLAGLST